MEKDIFIIFQKLSDLCPGVSFEAELWDGTSRRYGGGSPVFKITLDRQKTVEKILSSGTLGFGEEYMYGNIIVDGDLQAMLGTYDQWRQVAGKLSLAVKTRLLLSRIFSLGNFRNAQKNIRFHYDIGNDFYSRWLDESLTYSCAYFPQGDESLLEAQNRKHEHICRKLRLREGESLVDIGCGWGQMMFYAAKNYGVKCVGYTLSENQYQHVLKKIAAEKLENQIKVVFGDFRQVGGLFDKFVSVGMFEHVGRRYYPDFFSMVKRILKPGGTGLLHTIGSQFGAPTDPFIAKYIFPGGYIPDLASIASAMSRQNLVFFDIEDLRPHYAKTIDCWIRNFEAAIEPIENMMAEIFRDRGKARIFCRMWRLYLNASAASFRTGGNRLYQVVFTNGIDNNLPLTREYIYY